MENKQDFSFLSADGVHQVHGVAYPVEKARAVVQIVHGISEYAERYEPFIQFLNDHGFSVIAHDHLGHGLTAAEGEYGQFPAREGWTVVNEDVHQVRQLAAIRFPGLPHFLLGHSMGSFQARTYLIRFPGTVDGCILSGTGQEDKALVAVGKALAGAICKLRGPAFVSDPVTALSLGAYNAKFQPNRTTADWISRDEAVVDAYVADPLCQFVPTVGMFYAMMDGLQKIGDPRQLTRMDKSTPIALFSGDADPVGSMGKGVEKVYQLFRQAGCTDVTCKLYAGARHEILNELNRQEVYQDMLDWLEERLAAL